MLKKTPCLLNTEPVSFYTLIRKVESMEENGNKSLTATSHCLSRMGYSVNHGPIKGDFSLKMKKKKKPVLLTLGEEENMSCLELRQDVRELESNSLRHSSFARLLPENVQKKVLYNDMVSFSTVKFSKRTENRKVEFKFKDYFSYRCDAVRGKDAECLAPV